MGDSRRFHEFAKLIHTNFPGLKAKPIVDVAGGKGFLNLALQEQGFENITTFDKRTKKGRVRLARFRYAFFDWRSMERFALAVGMHPDEGTDHIIMYAVRNKIPFVVCPCCIKPSATQLRSNYKFVNWIEHLRRLALPTHNILEQNLKINGKRLVLIGKPI